MSSNTFLAADLHLSHRGIVTFLRADGVTKERPWDNIHEMDEAIIHNWNSVVTPRDKVYLLGDAVINRSALPIIGRLNGQKILVMGNHDCMRASEYLEYFHDIKACVSVDGFICTHIPLHPDELHRWKGNAHGHLHSNRVMTEYSGNDEYRFGEMEIDKRYICVSMEHIDYTPISLDELNKRFLEQQ